MATGDGIDTRETGSPKKAGRNRVSFWASVKLTVLMLSMIACTVLVGAWCPQEAQVGRAKVFEAFPHDMADFLIKLGVSDIFHTPFFLFLIAMLTVNMVACSFQRVFPKVRTLRTPMPFFNGEQISKMPYGRQVVSDSSRGAAGLELLVGQLRKRGFRVEQSGMSINAEFGKYARLAATVTHIGLLTLLAGVTVTSWTGFSGFEAVRQGESMSLANSQHSRLWIGKLPAWTVKVVSTRRENHPSGEPKQWFSDLEVRAADGRLLKKGQISVNNPLSYDGTDIYQSTWGLDHVMVSFNGVRKALELRPMGKRYAAFLPLDRDSILIFSVLDQKAPLRLFAKRPDWSAPKLLATLTPGKSVDLGGVRLEYIGAVPISGLHYKHDPGIIIVFVAFAFIITGVLMAMVPHRQVWATLDDQADGADAEPGGAAEKSPLRTSGTTSIYIGGRSVKARVGFERMMDKLIEQLEASQAAPGLAESLGERAEGSPVVSSFSPGGDREHV